MVKTAKKKFILKDLEKCKNYLYRNQNYINSIPAQNMKIRWQRNVFNVLKVVASSVEWHTPVIAICTGSWDQEDHDPGWPGQKARPYPQNNQNKKDWGVAQVYSTCLARAKTWIQTLVPPQKKKKCQFRLVYFCVKNDDEIVTFRQTKKS
jgi:hypothetical protein